MSTTLSTSTPLIPYNTSTLSLLTTNHHALSSSHRRVTFLSRFSLRRHCRLNDSSQFTWLISSSDDDQFRGWNLPQPPFPNKPSGFPTYVGIGIGASVVILLATVAQFLITTKGIRVSLRSSSSSLSAPVMFEAEETGADSDVDSGAHEIVSETNEVESPGMVTEFVEPEKHPPRVITAAVDSTQLEAVHVLKKLKIIDDVTADELCTRRDYARWLVRASSLLERNPKYKISTAVTLSGSSISAYEDVPFGDQDFDSIQALAEAGVVPSKLSSKNNLDESFNFFPGRFISRRDLIDWRGLLEYDFASIRNQEILKQKLNLLDVREMSTDEGSGLSMDMLAGDNSLLRRVFGQIRRLQPNKPSTVAQAAVALISGRMTEAIQNELSRLEADEASRKVAIEEIKQELLDRGDIERYWTQKMEEVNAHGLEVQELYMDAVNTLEQERIMQETAFNGFLKEKAAMECQKQLLVRLKEEIGEMSEKLISERAEHVAEEENTQTLRFELEFKNKGVLDAKAVLEAEIEALQILRSWIEDEAKKSEARAKVLEEVVRRWRCDRNTEG